MKINPFSFFTKPYLEKCSSDLYDLDLSIREHDPFFNLLSDTEGCAANSEQTCAGCNFTHTCICIATSAC